MRVSAGIFSIVCLAATLSGCSGASTPASPVGNQREVVPVFTLTSSAFSAEQRIPARFAMSGTPGAANTSIPYEWSGAPSETKSFALVLVDRAPAAHDWIHWAVVDMPSTTTSIAEGASRTAALPSGARELTTTYGSAGYGGPMPPPGSGPHPYVATVYALDTSEVALPGTATLAKLEGAFEGHVLGKASLTGYFER